MKKTTIAENIRLWREERGVTLNELARQAGVDRGNLSKLENGVAGASLETLARIAATLKVSLADLVQDGSNVREIPGGIRRIPIIPWNQVSTLSEKKYPRETHMQSVVLHQLAASAETFALILEDDSMEPTFRRGDMIIVDPERQPKPGSFVIACVDTETYFRQYRDLGEHVIELLPVNDLYPRIRSSQKTIRIMGTVISHRRDLEK